MTLDVDATIVASGKRKAKATYRSATRDVPYERGYQPVTVYSPELGCGGIHGVPPRQYTRQQGAEGRAGEGVAATAEINQLRVGFGWMRLAIKRT